MTPTRPNPTSPTAAQEVKPTDGRPVRDREGTSTRRFWFSFDRWLPSATGDVEEFVFA